MQLPGTSKYIYGIQETNTPRSVLTHGWMMGYAEVGDNPEPHPGVDYSVLADMGYGTICRVQYRWGKYGTFPRPDKLDAYIERVRTCVKNSKGVRHWQIGNEPNVPQEWNDGWRIFPKYAARCYNRAWTAIHDLRGHELDEVITPPVGPWNDQVGIGWVPYFQEMLEECMFVDGIAVHSYAHGSDPALITSEAMMDEPYQDCHYNFRAYRDFLEVVPPRFSWGSSRPVPVYITETNQYGEWLDASNGWVQAMYKEVDDWNQTSGTQKIRAALLYRWKGDQWHIEGKDGVIDDFRRAQSLGYTWPVTDPPIEPPEQPRILSIQQSITLNWSNGTQQTFSGTLEEQ